MRRKVIGLGILLMISLAGCSQADPSPAPSVSGSAPAPTSSQSTPAKPRSIVIGAQVLTVTDASGSQHEYTYDQWPEDLVPLATDLFGAAPRTSQSSGDSVNPPLTTYLWAGLFLVDSQWAADKSGVARLIVYAQGASDVDIMTVKGVRVGDSAAAVAQYPVFCNVAKKCFENVSTSSGASTTLRVLDSSSQGAGLVIGYVDATGGVTDIITADSSWGTRGGIDVRD